MLLNTGGLSGGDNSILNMITLILIFVLVVFLAYISTKFIAKYQSNVFNNRSNIRIIESFSVGNNKFIAIAKIGEEYYALAVSKDNISLIDKINPDDLKNLNEDGTTGPVNKLNFKDILSQIKNKNSKEDSEDTK